MKFLTWMMFISWRFAVFNGSISTFAAAMSLSIRSEVSFWNLTLFFNSFIRWMFVFFWAENSDLVSWNFNIRRYKLHVTCNMCIKEHDFVVKPVRSLTISVCTLQVPLIFDSFLFKSRIWFLWESSSFSIEFICKLAANTWRIRSTNARCNIETLSMSRFRSSFSSSVEPSSSSTARWSCFLINLMSCSPNL